MVVAFLLCVVLHALCSTYSSTFGFGIWNYIDIVLVLLSWYSVLPADVVLTEYGV